LVVLAVGHALTWAGFDITKTIFDGLEAVAQVISLLISIS
jgi:hypothetical protein